METSTKHAHQACSFYFNYVMLVDFYIFYFIYILVLTPADESHHIDKHKFTVPFVCGARDLGEALRRIAEGAAMIRTKGQAGTG